MYITKSHSPQGWALMALVLTFGPITLDARENRNEFEGVLSLQTDAPAVLDAPITITATLQNAHAFSPPFYFSFSKLSWTSLVH